MVNEDSFSSGSILLMGFFKILLSKVYVFLGKGLVLKVSIYVKGKKKEKRKEGLCESVPCKAVSAQMIECGASRQDTVIIRASAYIQLCERRPALVRLLLCSVTPCSQVLCFSDIISPLRVHVRESHSVII